MSQIIEELHLFIHSLSPNQKKRFTKQCKLTKSDSNSLLLFTLLKRFKEYDKKRLTKFLRKNNRDKLADNLYTETNLLFNLLFKTVSSMTDEKSVENKLNNQFKYAKILFERNLFVKPERMLRKLEKDTIEYDLKILLLEIYKYKHRMEKQTNERGYSKSIDKMHEKERKLLTAINLENELRYIYDKIFLLDQEVSMLSKKEVNTRLVKIETYLDNIDKAQCNCFGTKIFYLSAMAKLYELKSDRENVFKYMDAIANVYKSYPSASKASDFQYSKFLANYLNSLVKFNKPPEQFETMLAEIKSIEIESPFEVMVHFSNVNYLEFVYYLRQGDFKKMDKLAPELTEGLEKYDAQMKLGRKVTIWSNLMIYYFLKQDFDAVHSLIQKILTDGRSSRRKDIFNKAKLFELLTHYELNNTYIFGSLIAKVRRSFRDKEDSDKLAELIKLVCKLMDAHYKKAALSKKDFEAALQKFNKIDRTKNEKLPYDEIEIWLKSKVDRLPMQQIAEQMLQNK